MKTLPTYTFGGHQSCAFAGLLSLLGDTTGYPMAGLMPPGLSHKLQLLRQQRIYLTISHKFVISSSLVAYLSGYRKHHFHVLAIPNPPSSQV